MPELPEVETIVRKLQQVLPGKKIVTTQQYHPKSLIGSAAELLHLPITQVSRRAKIIRIHFDQGQNLLIHLKMTGQLIFTKGQTRLGGGHPTPDWINQLPSKHTRASFTFDDASQLFFNDQRLFGWIKVLMDDQVAAVFSHLAPDVIDDAVTTEYVQKKLKNRGQNIKQLILDNTIMCGLGNIYACDALNQAKIHPLRPAKSLSTQEIELLVRTAKETLNKGIAMGGTTFDGKYVDIDGMAGQYQSVLRVYGRAGKPCLNCGAAIVKTQIGGRGTYFCENCQV